MPTPTSLCGRRYANLLSCQENETLTADALNFIRMFETNSGYTATTTTTKTLRHTENQQQQQQQKR